ncbi:hypothetical protein VCV18_001927 [Metarhizium anisopliae]
MEAEDVKPLAMAEEDAALHSTNLLADVCVAISGPDCDLVSRCGARFDVRGVAAVVLGAQSFEGGSTEALLSGIVSDLESPWSCSAGYEELSCEEDDCRRGGGEKTATAPAWRSRGKERRQGPMLALLKIGNWETVGAERRRRERSGRGVARRWTVEERVSQSDKRDELGLRRERCNV